MLTIAAIIVVFLIVVFAEYLSRFKGVHSELTRKMVHILVGAFVAFWPFFLSWRVIQLLSLAFLVVVIISIRLDIFGSIHAVKRGVFGELLFAVVIGFLAFIVDDKWIFAAAMLHLSLADGFAAIAGLAWGDGSTYRILGRTKSLVGSLAFFFTSLGIMLAYAMFSGNAYSSVSMIWLPVAATITENIAGEGTDNIAVPLLVALVLSSAL
jgi:dolichol kinase